MAVKLPGGGFMAVMKVVSVTEMLSLEEESAKTGLGTAQLMENAGCAVAQSVRRILSTVAGKHIIVLVGPGNNGGDGLVAARYLSSWGSKVVVFLTRDRSDDNNLKKVRGLGITIIGPDMSGLDGLLSTADAALDALFGTGQIREIDGIYQEVLTKLVDARGRCPGLKVFAVDLPSGLNADTGQPDLATPFVDYTLTLGLPKRGLYTPEGAGRAGEIIVVDIGFSPHLVTGMYTELITPELARALLPVRSPYAHKGSFGRVMVIAGSENYFGAAYLSCAGAARVGAGCVALASSEGVIAAVATKIPEVVFIPLSESVSEAALSEAAELAKMAADFNAVLIGPGLGTRVSEKFIMRLLADLPPIHIVLDADALNALAKVPEWWRKIKQEVVITPHPGEMGRLAGLTIEEVQAGRIDIAQEKATKWGKTVVLKGAFTVVAAPDGRCRISPFANAAMASAGTGDILAGVISGLLGQGLSIFDAASLGVYLHARAGERAKTRVGEVGMLASDILPELPQSIQEQIDILRGGAMCS